MGLEINQMNKAITYFRLFVIREKTQRLNSEKASM